MFLEFGIKCFEFRFSWVYTDEDNKDSPTTNSLFWKSIDLISDKFPYCLTLILEISETVSFEGRNNIGVLSGSLLLMRVNKGATSANLLTP